MPKGPLFPVTTGAELDRLLSEGETIRYSLKGSLGDQINQLKQCKNKLEGAQRYITEKKPNLSPYTKRTATNAITRLLMDNVNPKLAEKQALQEAQKNFANRVVVPDSSGVYAGNGKFYIQFVNIGMGDCTLITTPKGVKIMVDCGSHAMEDVTSLIPGYDSAVNGTAERIVGNAIKCKTFLNGSGTIDILVLTHKDPDHHNKLTTILRDTIGGSMKIKFVYFGGADDLVDFTGSSAYIKEIAGETKGVLRKVDLHFNGSEKQVVKWINGEIVTATSGTANQIGQEYIDPATGEMVLYYEDGDSDFRLSALASNVKGYWRNDKDFVIDDSKLKGAGEMKLNGEEPNKRCLVVMVRCFGQNILVTGDATVVTEKFMLRFFLPSLQAVKTLRMGHHGSPTSSCQDFVNALTALNLAVASTGGQKTIKHHLPKKRILDLYNIDRISNDARAHDVWAFEKDTDSKAQNYFPRTTRKLFATGSNDTVAIWREKNT